MTYRIENDRIVFFGVTSADRIKVCSISGATPDFVDASP